MKAWVSKYALTKGILEWEAEISLMWPNMINNAKNISWYVHGDGKDWHRTRDGAIAKAEAMRKAKIAALKKQIVKLEAMKFE